MSIISLYKDYYQKSTLFLYPALKIRRGSSVTPIGTYLAWGDIYKPEDKKLICIYYLRDDKEFMHFEKDKLIGNDLFDRFIPLEDDKGAYVFDYSSLGDDYECVLNGKYSEISIDYRLSIMVFFAGNRDHAAYIESYLYPKKYFGLYAELLCANPRDVPEMEILIRSVGELCTPPDLEKETVNEQLKTLNIKLDCLDLSKNQ